MIRYISLMLWSGALIAAPCQDTYQKAYQAKKQKQYQQAQRYLKQTETKCHDYKLLYLRANIEEKLNHLPNALKYYNQAISITTQTNLQANALARKANVLASLNQVPDAIVLLETATDIYKNHNPNKIPSWFAALRLHLDQQLQQQGLISSQQITQTLASKAWTIKPKINIPIHFAYDSAKLDYKAKQQVQALGQALSKSAFSNKQFELVGHTDQQGDAQYNQTLSERRAQATAKALIQAFPALKQQISWSGAGETKLRHPGNSPEAHRLNRRVEVTIR